MPIKKYLFVQKIKDYQNKQPFYKKYQKEIVDLFHELLKQEKNLGLNPADFMIGSRPNKLRYAFSLSYDGFDRLIYWFYFLENVRRVQNQYNDGDFWRVAFLEKFLHAFGSFSDKVLIFLYYFYPEGTFETKNEKAVCYSRIFGEKAKTKYDSILIEVKKIFNIKEFHDLMDYRDLLTHRGYPFYATVFDKNTPQGKAEARIHTTDFQFGDFDIDRPARCFMILFPELLNLMRIVGKCFHEKQT